MSDQVLRFLSELDDALQVIAGPNERLNLYQVGRMALIQHFGSTATTKDFDVVDWHECEPLMNAAREQFSEGTANAKRLGIYLETVPNGLPPVPNGFKGRCQEVPGPWRVIRLWRPEPHDLAATKLKRFAPKDRQDIQHLCDHGLLQAGRLREALEEAFLWSHEKDGDPDREQAFANFDRVLAYLDGRIKAL